MLAELIKSQRATQIIPINFSQKIAYFYNSQTIMAVNWIAAAAATDDDDVEVVIIVVALWRSIRTPLVVRR